MFCFAFLPLTPPPKKKKNNSFQDPKNEDPFPETGRPTGPPGVSWKPLPFSGPGSPVLATEPGHRWDFPAV